jgi:hypothetical protein
MAEYATKIEDEGTLVRDGEGAVEKARALHHLATGDPEPERGGVLTGPAHEELYGLERAEGSAALWRAAGVHPIKNRALVGDEDGAENLRGAVESKQSPGVLETATARRASDKK